MKNLRFVLVLAVFIALLILGGTQSVWAGPDQQTVPTFTPVPNPTENNDAVVDAPSGTVMNFGTFSAGAVGCVGCTVTVYEYNQPVAPPPGNYQILQTPVSVVASSPTAMVIACFPISTAKYPGAQVWMYDVASGLWSVAPVYLSDDGLLCGYAFGSAIFAPLAP